MILNWVFLWACFAYATNKYVLSTGNFNASLQLGATFKRRGVFYECVFRNGRLVNKKCRKVFLENDVPNDDFDRRKKRSLSNTNRVCCLSDGSNRKCDASVCNTKTETKLVKKFKVSFSTTEISTLCKSTSVSTFPPPLQQKLTQYFGNRFDLASLQKRYCQKVKVTKSEEVSKTVTETSLSKCKNYLLNNYNRFYSNQEYQKSCCKCSGNKQSHQIDHYAQLLLDSLKQKGKEEELICYYFNNGKYPQSYQLIAYQLDRSSYWENSNSYLNRLCSKRKHRPGFRKNGKFNYVQPNIELYAICHYAQTGRYFNNQPVAEIVKSRWWYKPDSFFERKCGIKQPYRPLEFWFGQENEFSESLRPTLPSHCVKNSRKVNGYWVVHPKDWQTINDYIHSGEYFKQRHALKRASYPFGNPILKRCTNYLVNRYQYFQTSANKPCCRCNGKSNTHLTLPSYPVVTSHHSKLYSKKTYSASHSVKRKVVKSSSNPSVSYSKSKVHSYSTSNSYTTRTSYPSYPTHSPQDVYVSVQLNKGLLRKLQELKRQIESLTYLVKGQSGDFSALAKTVLSLFQSIERPHELFKVKFSQNIQPPSSLNYNQLKSLINGLQVNLVGQLNNAVSKVVQTIQKGLELLNKRPGQKRINLETTCSTSGLLY